MSNDDREARTQRLYELPLDEFTAARDELVRRLRTEGEPEAAAAVKGLRKPSVAAWALNQVRRNDPKRVDALIDAGRRLGEAQERLLAGGGRDLLDRAIAEERQLVDELAAQAERELAAAGRPASASVEEKLRATLHAVASDVEARELLAAGRLVRDHAATGLGPLIRPAARREAPPAREKGRVPARADGAAARKARELARKLERARARQEEANAALADAERRLDDARDEAERAAAALRRAEASERRAREKARRAAERTTELEGAANAVRGR